MCESLSGVSEPGDDDGELLSWPLKKRTKQKQKGGTWWPISFARALSLPRMLGRTSQAWQEVLTVEERAPLYRCGLRKSQNSRKKQIHTVHTKILQTQPKK